MAHYRRTSKKVRIRKRLLSSVPDFHDYVCDLEILDSGTIEEGWSLESLESWGFDGVPGETGFFHGSWVCVIGRAYIWCPSNCIACQQEEDWEEGVYHSYPSKKAIFWSRKNRRWERVKIS